MGNKKISTKNDVKNQGYYSNIRTDIIKHIAKGNNRILEAGCGSGSTLKVLKDEGKASYTAGIDIMQFDNKHLDSFICGNIEQIDLKYPAASFDYIICGDVLEHLIDPWSMVKKLNYFLKPGGVFIASIPNFCEIKNILSIILKKNFKYKAWGIMDSSHLRFFCKNNCSELFGNDVFIIKQIVYGNPNIKYDMMNILTLGLLKSYFSTNFIIIAVKK